MAVTQAEAQARQTLQRMRSEVQAIASKIAELESQKDEHKCDEALDPLLSLMTTKELTST